MNILKLRIVLLWFVMMTVCTITKPVPAELHVNPPPVIGLHGREPHGLRVDPKQVSRHGDLQSSDYSATVMAKNDEHTLKPSSMNLFLGKMARTRHLTAPKSLPLTKTERDFERKSGMPLLSRLRKKREVTSQTESITKSTTNTPITASLKRNIDGVNNPVSFKTAAPTSTTEADTGLETSTPIHIEKLPVSNARNVRNMTSLPTVQTSVPEQVGNSVQMTLESTNTALTSSPPASRVGPVKAAEKPQSIKASSTTLPNFPQSSTKFINKTERLVTPTPDATKQPKTLLPSSTLHSATTPMPIDRTNISLDSVKQDIEERTSGSECIGPNCNGPFTTANQWTGDAYWALGSLVTVLLLLTIAVLYTGLWKKRNHFSNPISDVNCHAKASPTHKGRTDIKDLLKTKLHHLKNLNNSPLSTSRRHNGNGRISRSYLNHSDYLPLLAKTDDEEEEFCRQWGPPTSEHSL